MGKISIYTIIFISFAAHLVMGQGNEAREQIEAARIALITDRLELTPEQAEKFWPIYNEYSEQRKELARELQQMRKGIDREEMTEEQGQQLMERTMNIRERQLQLEKQYARRMNSVITAQQLLSLRQAEEDFRKMILRRLEERKRQQLRNQQMRNRREEIIKNRRNN